MGQLSACALSPIRSATRMLTVGYRCWPRLKVSGVSATASRSDSAIFSATFGSAICDGWGSRVAMWRSSSKGRFVDTRPDRVSHCRCRSSLLSFARLSGGHQSTFWGGELPNRHRTMVRVNMIFGRSNPLCQQDPVTSKPEQVSAAGLPGPPEQVLLTRSAGLPGAQSPAPRGAFCYGLLTAPMATHPRNPSQTPFRLRTS